MTNTPPPGGPDRDPYGQPIQPPPPTFPVGPPQGYPGYPPPPRPGGATPEASRTKAIWALVLAILPLCLTWIAAAVLAIIVLVGPRDGQRRGRGMAWASLVIVALWLVGSVIALVVVVASIPADRDDDGEVTSGGEVFAEDLQLGDCLAEAFDEYDEDVYTVTVVPCDEPHNGEVFHETQLDDATFPGEDEVFARADDVCFEAFEPWVGTSYDDSFLDFTYYAPSEDSWDYGDRLITCVVISPDDVDESLEGSER